MKRTFLFGAPMLALLAACSADSIDPSKITADDENQAAVISASDATAEDVSVLYASDVGLGSAATDRISGGLLMSRSPSASPLRSWAFGIDCTYSASSGRFSCPPITDGQLTLTRDFAFYDASSTGMSAFNATTTASANFHINVSGVHVADNGADTVSRDRNMTVTGLAGTETSRTWNGTGTRNDGGYRNLNDVNRTYHVNDNVTLSDIVVNLPRSTNPWPMSGTITRVISGTAGVQREGISKSFALSKTVTITFNGTQYATVAVGGSTYTLDLTTGTWTKN